MIVICSGARDPICKGFAIRPFVAADAQALSRYFHQLSSGDRYNRFFGATVPPSPSDLKKLALPGRVKSLVAIRGNGQIIGEARYASGDAVEFAISVASTERCAGIGSAFLSQIEQHAAHAGAATMVGDTLRTNSTMISLAKSRGFRLTHAPGDWTLVRFEKHVLDPVWMLPVSQGATLIDRQR
jgi:GNAT superfamily N-acetyltransferase